MTILSRMHILLQFVPKTERNCFGQTWIEIYVAIRISYYPLTVQSWNRSSMIFPITILPSISTITSSCLIIFIFCSPSGRIPAGDHRLPLQFQLLFSRKKGSFPNGQDFLCGKRDFTIISSGEKRTIWIYGNILIIIQSNGQKIDV